MRVIDLVNKMNSKADEIAQLELDLKKLRTTSNNTPSAMSVAAAGVTFNNFNYWEDNIEKDTRTIVKIAWAHLQKLRSEYTLM